RGREGGAPFTYNLPRRQRGAKSGRGVDLVPDGAGERLARRVDEPVAGADGDGEAARKGEDPFRGGVEDAEDRRLPGGRGYAEMCVDDGAELGRRRELRHQRGGG